MIMERKLKIIADTKILASKSFNETQDWTNHHNHMVPYKMLKDSLNLERNILNEYIILINKLNNV
jgi:hypothetical protein